MSGAEAGTRTFPLADLAATARFAAGIAAALRPGDVVALSGTLGAGKTTLARAILGMLGHAGEVPSPSFSIVECYDPPQVRIPIVHADFYRLTDPGQVAEIGLDDYRQGAALIAEWPENAGGFGHEPACLAIRLVIPQERLENAAPNLTDPPFPESVKGGEITDGSSFDKVSHRSESVGNRRYAIVDAGPDWVLRGPWLDW